MHTPGAETTPPISRRSAPRRISIRAPAPGATVPRYSGRISGRCFDPHSHAESDPFRYRCRKGQAGRDGLRETAPRGHRSALENEPQALRCRSHDQGRIEIRGDSARPLTKLNADADSDAGSARIAGPSMTPARTNFGFFGSSIGPAAICARARPTENVHSHEHRLLLEFRRRLHRSAGRRHSCAPPSNQPGHCGRPTEHVAADRKAGIGGQVPGRRRRHTGAIASCRRAVDAAWGRAPGRRDGAGPRVGGPCVRSEAHTEVETGEAWRVVRDLRGYSAPTPDRSARRYRTGKSLRRCRTRRTQRHPGRCAGCPSGRRFRRLGRG